MYFDGATENELCANIDKIVANIPGRRENRPIHVVYVDADNYRQNMISRKLVLFFAMPEYRF